jgi:hypothetical protein
MTFHHKIIALDLRNATVQNFDHWCSTTDFIKANATKDFIRYRILEQNEENPMHFIFIINDYFFGTAQKYDFRTIDIPIYVQEEFIEQCIPIQLNEIELYRSVLIDWIFNNNNTKAKTGFELRSFQKYKESFEYMMHPHFTSCVTCVDVVELGFTLRDFFSPFNDKFKVILEEFKMHYAGGGYLNRVKLSRVYLLEKYIMGFGFQMENESIHHFHFNINFEDMLYDYINPFTFDQEIEKTLDEVLDKINAVGLDQLTALERKVLTENK